MHLNVPSPQQAEAVPQDGRLLVWGGGGGCKLLHHTGDGVICAHAKQKVPRKDKDLF